jgi:hypothetical protein
LRPGSSAITAAESSASSIKDFGHFTGSRRPCGASGRTARGRRQERGRWPPCTHAPYGTSRPLRAPKAPGENRPHGPAGGKGCNWQDWVRRGPAVWDPTPRAKEYPLSADANRLLAQRNGRWDPHVLWDRTPERSVPLALASLVLGSHRTFSRFFEISCCRFEISIRRPEAHFARCGPIGTTVSLLL